jgi:SAM-dependent methyltransferase
MPLSLKAMIKRIPVVGPNARRIARFPLVARARGLAFGGSASYWESRYRTGGTSGAGSYGRLARFKASILNAFVEEKGIRSVVELGCGDGAQLELANYPTYVGIDVAAASIERCMARFGHDRTKRFYLGDTIGDNLGPFDLALSLDVVYHLVEDRIFDAHMKSLFASSGRYAIIYASNYDATTNAPHVRHRKFTDWISRNADHWQPAGRLANPFPFDPSRPNQTSFADFYFFAWRETSGPPVWSANRGTTGAP